METSSKKRDRNANFSSKETETLVSLIESRKHVIENKKNNTMTWQDKEKSWKDIEEKFNRTGGEVYRDAKHLKVKYESMKRDVRKKLLSQGISTDSNSKCSDRRFTPIDLRVHEIMSISIKDDDSESDSDQLINQTSNEFSIQIEKVDVDESHSPKIRCVDEDVLTPGIALSDARTHQKVWNEWKPNSLKFQEHPASNNISKIREKKYAFDDVAEVKKGLASLQKKLIGEEIQEKILRKILIREEIEHKREMYKLEKEEMLLKIELLKNGLRHTASQKTG